MTRQLLQWLTSKLKDRLQNMRYFLAFFRRARNGRGERDTPVESVIHPRQPGRRVLLVLA